MACSLPPKYNWFKKILIWLYDHTLAYLFPKIERVLIKLAHKEKDKKGLESITKTKYWKLIRKIS